EFSSFGPWIAVAALGVDIIGPRSTTYTPSISYAPRPTHPYDHGSGTSFAAPLVAGTALLVRSQHSTWTPAQVAARLRSTARDAGPVGTDPYYGAGVLDAAAAVGAAGHQPPSPPRYDQHEPNDTIDTATPLTSTKPESAT